eukprot:TRINITY_DN896_c0_g1_i4.p1 TRINITY_DN896_c0_g1~~TRINITY_DN896_c0_g1_i4.p1  ORF type:complete len:737 (+),score=248.20 TRINITY_DN896_c0_g1_i4:67-2277(+)
MAFAVQQGVAQPLLGETGERIDDSLREGPKKERQPTDSYCVIVFGVFLFTWLIVFIFAGIKGNLKRVSSLHDFDGKECGHAQGYEDYKFLYWGAFPSTPIDFGTEKLTGAVMTVCVKSCPTWTDKDTPPATLECKQNTFFDKCDTTRNVKEISSLNRRIFVYKSTPYLGSFCLPAEADYAISTVGQTTSMWIQKMIRGVINHLTKIALVILLCVLLGFVTMIMIRYLAGCIVWLILFGTVALLLILGSFFIVAGLTGMKTSTPAPAPAPAPTPAAKLMMIGNVVDLDLGLQEVAQAPAAEQPAPKPAAEQPAPKPAAEQPAPKPAAEQPAPAQVTKKEITTKTADGKITTTTSTPTTQTTTTTTTTTTTAPGTKTTTTETTTNNANERTISGPGAIGLGVVFIAIGLILALVIFCNFRNIRLVVGIFKATADFVGEAPGLILITFIQLLLNVGYLLVWSFVLLWIYTLSDKVATNHNPFGEFKMNGLSYGLYLYHVFIGFWIEEFLVQALFMIICAAAAVWYFKLLMPGYEPTQTGVKWALQNHLGSVALGSGFLATIKFIKFLAQSLKMKAAEGGDANKGLILLAACLECLANCIEAAFRFIGFHGYVQISLTGKNFCEAARDGFGVILRHVLLTATLIKLRDIFIFLGQLIIYLVPIIVGIWWISKSLIYSVEDPILIVVILLVVCYGVSQSFMTVWSAGSEAIMHIFCVDEEVNSGAKYAPEVIREVDNEVRA